MTRRLRLTKSEKIEKETTDAMKTAAIKSEEVQELFDYWVTVHKGDSKRKPLLDIKRRKLLAIALYDYDMEYCKQAIDGCANSHFHMGQNNRAKIYNSLELIFRDSSTIERFAGYMEWPKKS